MRAAFLGLIILCELLILLTRDISVNSSSLSFITTLVVVVLAAFTVSALLRNVKTLTLTKNYGISGVIGIAAGVLFYMWISNNLDSMLSWLADNGLYILLIVIFVSSVT